MRANIFVMFPRHAYITFHNGLTAVHMLEVSCFALQWNVVLITIVSKCAIITTS
jgi:hypothetical protein